MIIDTFVKSKNGIGITNLRFTKDSHSFIVINNVLFFKQRGTRYRIFFRTFAKVYLIDDKSDLSKIVESDENGVFYSYINKKYIHKDPKSSLNDFLSLNFIENQNGKLSQEKIFYVMFD